jgi:outer membrane protein TolC
MNIAFKCNARALMPSAVMLMLIPVAISFAGDAPGELTLAEGLKIAVQSNRIVSIAAFESALSSSDIISARAGMLPRVNAFFNQTMLAHQPGAVMLGRSAYTAQNSFLSYGVNMRQTLYDFGATGSRYDAAKASLELTRLDTMRIRNLVALDFILTYYDLLESGKMIETAGKDVERLASHLSTAQNLFQEGVITKNDLLQAEVRLSDARQKLFTVKNLRELNASRLNNILARPLTSEVKASETVQEPAVPLDVESLWDTAVKRRPELEIIAGEIKVTELEERVKRSEYFPRFFAEGGYNYVDNRYALHDENWALVLGLDVNLFSGGATNAAVTKVRHKRSQLEKRKEKLVEDIKLEVERAFLDLKSASEKVAVSKDAVGQADENLRINKVRYEEGIGTATDVLDAITLLSTAETNYCRAGYDLERAQAALLYATGADLPEVYR